MLAARDRQERFTKLFLLPLPVAPGSRLRCTNSKAARMVVLLPRLSGWTARAASTAPLSLAEPPTSARFSAWLLRRTAVRGAKPHFIRFKAAVTAAIRRLGWYSMPSVIYMERRSTEAVPPLVPRSVAAARFFACLNKVTHGPNRRCTASRALPRTDLIHLDCSFTTARFTAQR